MKYNNYVEHGTLLEFNFAKKYTFGPWNIKFSLVDIDNRNYRVNILDVAYGK